MPKPHSVNLFIDGGARGNPGPAAAGVVLTDELGKAIHQAGYFLGEATNNVAEYQGLIRGLEAARQLGASEVNVFSDSELLVRQMNGQYRVKAAHLKHLHSEASRLCRQFAQCVLSHVPRERNVRADKLVNQAIDIRADVGQPLGPASLPRDATMS